MNLAIRSMLDAYACKSVEDQERALREIIQEIALLGLWRAKFFEHAAFYGGTALRILYGLDRFSEDLDFSLLKPQPDFSLAAYERAIYVELKAFNFDVAFERKEQTQDSDIESAFIKANTMVHFLKISVPWKTHKDKVLKVKLEVDTMPPLGFKTDAKQHFQPIPFAIKTFSLPDLFAGKMHALLFRKRVRNPKGRDWYDFLWYISRNIPVHIAHLQERAIQSDNWPKATTLDPRALQSMLAQRLAELDLDALKADVRPFLRDTSQLDAWSAELFQAAFARLSYE